LSPPKVILPTPISIVVAVITVVVAPIIVAIITAPIIAPVVGAAILSVGSRSLANILICWSASSAFVHFFAMVSRS
jgi:hypothetical protein